MIHRRATQIFCNIWVRKASYFWSLFFPPRRWEGTYCLWCLNKNIFLSADDVRKCYQFVKGIDTLTAVIFRWFYKVSLVWILPQKNKHLQNIHFVYKYIWSDYLVFFIPKLLFSFDFVECLVSLIADVTRVRAYCLDCTFEENKNTVCPVWTRYLYTRPAHYQLW